MEIFTPKQLHWNFLELPSVYRCKYLSKEIQMQNNEELLTAKQVAEILNCHVTQVYKMIKRGQLPSMIKFGERMSRMSRIQLEECLHNISKRAE